MMPRTQVLLLVIALVVPLAAASPTTAPANDPKASLAAATDKAAETSKTLEVTKKACLDKLHSTERYRSAAASVEAKRHALEAARLTGTAQEKLDASSDYNIARQAVEQMDRDELKGDPAVSAATHAKSEALDSLQIATKNYAAFMADQDKQQQQAAEAARNAAASEPKVVYDRFKDRTTVTSVAVEFDPKDNHGGVGKSTLNAVVVADGDKLPLQPAEVTLRFFTRSALPFYFSDTEKTLVLIVDGSRITFAHPSISSDRDDYGVTWQTVEIKASPSQMVQLSSAKLVECQIGSWEIALENKDLQPIRSFVDKLQISSKK